MQTIITNSRLCGSSSTLRRSAPARNKTVLKSNTAESYFNVEINTRGCCNKNKAPEIRDVLRFLFVSMSTRRRSAPARRRPRIYDYIYIDIYIYIYNYICMCICIYIYIYIYEYIYIYMHTYILLCMCINICVYIYIYIYIHMKDNSQGRAPGVGGAKTARRAPAARARGAPGAKGSWCSALHHVKP